MAQNSKRTYSTGERHYVKFCEESKISGEFPTFPASEDTLMYFAVYLARTCKQKTIKVYLSAIRHLHILYGHNLELTKFLRLQLLLRGIKRAQGDNTKLRKPILIQHLNLFYELLQIKTTTNNDSLMIWAAMSFAFFGFLRISEFTCNSNFDVTKHLSLSSISFHHSNGKESIKAIIKVSKTDPFRLGTTIHLGQSQSHICPVAAMHKYLSIRSKIEGPLFHFQSGEALNRSRLTLELRSLLSMGGYCSDEFAGHSFRIGAATSAAKAGLPPWLIKTMGRWSSDCYERYIRTPLSVLTGVSKQLASSY